VDAPVLGDAAVVADEFVGQLDMANIPSTGFAVRVAEVSVPATATKAAPGTLGTLDIDEALRVVNCGFPVERSLVLDAGRFFHHAAFNVRTGAVNSYVHTLEFGCIGLGMGNALGAAAGNPAKPVLMISGDGGFMLGGLAEFNTAVRNQLDIVVVILNDGAYGAEYIQFQHKGMDPTISTFDWPSLAEVATALGGVGYAVRTAAELERAMADLARRDRPALVEVLLDPEVITSPYH
jgi:thiamine pyrophosphate-dependent acetolactate synthase large subunit-like protein